MGTWGNTIVIQISHSELQLTAHHTKLLVKAGDKVKAGDIIGTIGGTTHTGVVYNPHLHYEVRKMGRRLVGDEPWGNPAEYWLDQGGQNMKTIVLSPGHGGSDPGAVGNGIRESDVVLRIALACRDWLNNEYTGHRIVMVRENDLYVSLPQRREITRRVGGHLYVSIHANSFRDPSANGFETFTFNGEVFEITRRAQHNIHTEIYNYLRQLGIRDRGQKRSKHWEPTNISAPTVLVEYGFVSNATEAHILADHEHCKRMGITTAIGIAKTMNLQKKTVAPTPPSPSPIEKNVFYRVVEGSYNNISHARAKVEELKRLGFDSAFILRHEVE